MMLDQCFVISHKLLILTEILLSNEIFTGSQNVRVVCQELRSWLSVPNRRRMVSSRNGSRAKNRAR